MNNNVMNKIAVITEYGCYSDAGFSVFVMTQDGYNLFKENHDFLIKYEDQLTLSIFNYRAEYESLKGIELCESDNDYRYSIDFEDNFDRIDRTLLVDDSEELDDKWSKNMTDKMQLFKDVAEHYLTKNNLLTN